jgi:hypothetical protein
MLSEVKNAKTRGFGWLLLCALARDSSLLFLIITTMTSQSSGMIGAFGPPSPYQVSNALTVVHNPSPTGEAHEGLTPEISADLLEANCHSVSRMRPSVNAGRVLLSRPTATSG